MAKRKITMTIDAQIFSAFKQYCKENAMNVSARVELLMRDYTRGKRR